VTGSGTSRSGSRPQRRSPRGGIIRSGWKLGSGPSLTELCRIREEADKAIDLTSSVGLFLKEDGTVGDVIPDKATDRAGIGPGMKLVAVNRRR